MITPTPDLEGKEVFVSSLVPTLAPHQSKAVEMAKAHDWKFGLWWKPRT
jgi:hypothetical protein